MAARNDNQDDTKPLGITKGLFLALGLTVLFLVFFGWMVARFVVLFENATR